MARRSNTRAAQGAGTIRQRKDGRREAGATVGLRSHTAGGAEEAGPTHRCAGCRYIQGAL